MRMTQRWFAGWVVFLSLTSGPLAFGGDWPQWRYDAGRGAASPEQLPDQLYLQ